MSDTVLRVADLTKRFGEIVAVDRLSFDVQRGEILGFLGPNGAGKTTTISMLCGLLRPDGGHIELSGERLAPGAARGLRAIGVCPQEIVVWDGLTCAEQLAFMGRMYGLSAAAARRRAGELLETFGLTSRASALGGDLSGGMRRRLNIALALVHSPALLFLDEPQAGLDPQSRLLVREHLRSLAGEVTVVLTTHDMEEAEKLSDRVCIVDRGRLLALDTVAAVKARLGEGDLIEIAVAEDAATHLRPLVEALQGEAVRTSIVDHTLSFATTDAVAVLPRLLAAVREGGLTLRGLRVRHRTLEDVFIRLTGRALRP